MAFTRQRSWVRVPYRPPKHAPISRREDRSVGIVLVRHGRVEISDGRRFKGHGVDLTPLSPEGVSEAEAAGRALVASPPDLILSSPMTRALQTAMIISWHVQRRVVVEMDLHEWMPDDRQDWQDGTIPQAAAADMEALGGEWPPGETRRWEPLSVVRSRVEAVLDRYREVGELLVVCHSVVIQAVAGVAACGHCEPVPFVRV
jgi:broad specificity phosphatase PhoE